ncbi:MAG: LON peptidase substrate-binding domain-containing protein [Alphaproteobacteria bacterium]
MTRTGHELQDLPGTIPIFPLTGVLLLPGGVLPLNIFEPRYLNMVDDALRTGRIIGMIQPAEAGAEGHDESPPVYSVGCAGRITAFRETDDGRFEIVLTGLSRFEVAHEVEGQGGYRRVVARWDRFRADLDEEDDAAIERAPLIAAFQKFAKRRRLGAEWGRLAEISDPEMVTWMAMAVPFHPNEKQALLECATSRERGQMLIALLKIASHEVAARAFSRQ